jgi:hypothetical protein
MKFIADGSLGRLAKWLRILGYDVKYHRSALREITKDAIKEGRIILTRSKKFFEENPTPGSVLINSEDLAEQLRELKQRLDLKLTEDLFLRCLLCNSPVESLVKQDAKDFVPEDAYKTHEEFFRCPSCARIYWHGSHLKNTRSKLSKIFPEFFKKSQDESSG